MQKIETRSIIRTGGGLLLDMQKLFYLKLLA